MAAPKLCDLCNLGGNEMVGCRSTTGGRCRERIELYKRGTAEELARVRRILVQHGKEACGVYVLPSAAIAEIYGGDGTRGDGANG